MGLSFIDLDLYIERRYLKSVRQLFEEKGEAAFREIERRMLHEVASFEDTLISTGGGAPCYADNMAFMNERGTTIYLKVSVDELVKRLEAGKNCRPVLQGRKGEELITFVRGSLALREPFYNQAAIVFDTEGMQTDHDVADISRALEEKL